MSYHFIPAKDITQPLTIAVAISGGSGLGKTFSALRLARGIANGGPIGFIDTENKRALHYRSTFPEMHHLDLSPFDASGNCVGYPPERWIEVIDAAEHAKLPVVVVDSFSHAWEGIGGVLEQHEQVLQAMGGNKDKSMLAWASVKPRYRRLIERIIRAQCHIILCIRAKPMVVDVRTGKPMRQNKLRRPDLHWDIACDRDLVFEMTTHLLMDPDRPGVPIPIKLADDHKGIFGQGERISEAMGQAMRQWSLQGGDGATKKLLDHARDVARTGTAAFTAYWQGDGIQHRALLKSIMPELQTLCQKADALTSDDSPFGHEPEAAPAPAAIEPDNLTNEELDRLIAEREARA